MKAAKFLDFISYNPEIDLNSFEVYTSDDAVAILKELQSGIEELDSRAGYDGNGMPTFSTDYIRKQRVNKLIQQKIDTLKNKGENNHE